MSKQATVDTPFDLHQLMGLLKTLGIASANLWGKAAKLDPSSAYGQSVYEELTTTLHSLETVVGQIIDLLEAQ
jgi:hypothetical protein